MASLHLSPASHDLDDLMADSASRSGSAPSPRGRGSGRTATGRNVPRSRGRQGPSRSDRSSAAVRPPRDASPAEPVLPSVDEDVDPKQLDRVARRELSSLEKDDADFVAAHLIMASRWVDDDPELAHQHALAALHKGGRIPVVRETLGITAYLGGDFALALRELRTHRRLSGSADNLPMMVDCERGLGRPERALELAASVDTSTLDTPVRVELAIARSGARLDLGQAQRALLELQIPELDPNVAFSYSPALFDAYAVVLDDLGRHDEAATWGKRASVAAAALADASGVDIVEYVDLDTSEGDSSS